MFKKVIRFMEDAISIDAKMEKDAVKTAANIRLQAIRQCELDILKAKISRPIQK